MQTDYGYTEEGKPGRPYDLRLLKRLYPYVLPYKRLFFTAIVLSIAVTSLELALPYLTKVAIDDYILAGKDQGVAYAGIARIAAIFLGAVLLQLMFGITHEFIMEYAGQSVIRDLRLSLFSHLQKRSITFFTKNPLGRLVTRVTNDVQNLHEFLTSMVTVFFIDFFLLLGISILLMLMHIRLALACFAILPLIIIATTYFSRLARDIFRELRIKIAQINSRFQETMDGIRIVQLFSQEARNYKEFQRLNNENYLVEMQQIKVFALFMPIIELMGSIAAALVIWYGGGQVIGKTLSLGALVAFISYMRMFFRPLRDIAEKYNIMQSAMASSERIFHLLDINEKTLYGRQTTDHRPWSVVRGLSSVVFFDNVWFSYVPGEWALKDVSFSVHPGQTIAIVGPTGSGKSTIVNLIEGFYEPVKGSISIAGLDIQEIAQENLRKRIALISQEVFLFGDTIRANIVGNARLTDERLMEITKAVHLDQVLAKLPNGLDTMLNQGGRALSSGERQLIAFARALAHDPEILILDEATSSIDTRTEMLIQAATKNFWKIVPPSW
ncbi:MAG: ABC transporter ATP-binding protein [Pseudomonadota bacterium]